MPEQPWFLFDVQAAQTPDNPDRGIARFVREQAREVAAIDAAGEVRFLFDPKFPTGAALEPIARTGRLTPNHPEGPGGRRPGTEPFVYYVGSPFEKHIDADTIWPRYARSPHAITAVTLYDLIPMRFPEAYLSVESERESYEARLGLVRNADLVLAISESTAADAIELLGLDPRRVAVIGAGVSDFWEPLADRASAFREAKAAVPALRPGFVFFTGGIDFRKNMNGMLAGYAALPPAARRDHPLVITCRMDAGAERELHRAAHELGIAGDVLFTNYIPDATLRALYRATDLFVFPALYEGFGLPLVEAMACGAPAIASDRASMQEIVTLPEARFDPESPAALARAIESALSDPALRGRLLEIAKGARRRFGWRAVAERTMAACRRTREDALRPRSTLRPLPAHRPSLALFTPMPPEPSGIADYSARLVTALAELADVDVFVESDPPRGDAIAPPPVRLLPAAAFPFLDAIGEYDEVLYVMGNSRFHAFAYEALLRRPGVVLAHEVRFTGLYSGYGAHRRGDARFFAEAVRSQHPNVPAAIFEKGFVTAEEAHDFGILLTSELLERSTRFLVHSRFAAEAVRAERPALASRVRPVAFGMAAPAVRGPRVEMPRPPLVATFGIVSATKRIEAFLRAAQIVARRFSDARFAVVGEVEPGEMERWRALSRSLGLADRVELTGRVDLPAYEDFLRRTSCAVQLRATTNGESSAAVGDCLRHAIPTIVSELGPAREYPAGSVRPLPEDAGVEALSSAIVEILERPDVARALSREAFELAKRSGFDVAAASLLDALFAPQPEAELALLAPARG